MQKQAIRFKELGLHGKMLYLRDNGKYLDSRRFGTFRIHLYQCNKFYVEVWTGIGLGNIAWIEICSDKLVAENYLSHIDISKSFGV